MTFGSLLLNKIFMENLFKLLSGPVPTAFGWTLLHAVWQIIILSMVYFVTILVTKKASIRYYIGLGVLTSQFFVSIMTFFWLTTKSTGINQGIFLEAKGTAITGLAKAMQYFNNNLPLIVALWSAGFVILSIKMINGYFWVTNLKNKASLVISEKIVHTFDSLKARMGIENEVLLKSSPLIDVPLMMGYLKPVVMLPVSLISGFSERQIELILAHELAHIKRNDYLVNLFQSFLDVVYFFHPLYWIVSAQIRKEREICTDQLALQFAGDKILLANTLIQLQETRITPALALAFGKKQSAFTERIYRILGMNSKTNFSRESVWILVGILVTFFSFAQQKESKKTEVIKEREMFSTVDTLVYPHNSVHINSDKGNFSIKDKKLYFNEKEIVLEPEKKILVDKYLEALDLQNIQMEAQSKLMAEQSKLMDVQSQKINEWSQKLTEDLKPLTEYSQQITLLSNEVAKKSTEFSRKTSKLDTDSKEYEKLQKRYDEEIEKLNSQIDRISEKMDEVSKKADLNNKDMDLVSKEMDERAAEMDKIAMPMDMIGKQIDETVKSIIDLLPEDIKSQINTDFDAPKPPKKPKRGVSAASPSAPPKAKRIPPIPPVKAISPDSPPKN